MKRFHALFIKLALTVAAFTFVFTLTACSGGTSGKIPSTQEIAQKLMQTCTYDELIELKDDVLYNQYDKLDKKIVKEVSVYVCSSGATVDEICVVRVNSEADIASAKQAIESRLKDQHEKFVDYVPEEIPKLDKAVTETNGTYIMMTAAADSEKATDAFKKMFE